MAHLPNPLPLWLELQRIVKLDSRAAATALGTIPDIAEEKHRLDAYRREGKTRGEKILGLVPRVEEV